MTDPAKLAQWFPTSVEVDLRERGAMRFAFPEGSTEDMTGEVTELDPLACFAFLWGEELLRLELEPEGSGCRLRLEWRDHHERYVAAGVPSGAEVPGG